MTDKKIKLYIASSFVDNHITQILSMLLEKEGFEITYKWWNEFSLDRNEVKFNNDRKGIFECDNFILYHSGKCSTGKFIESGMAHGFNKPIYLIGETLGSIKEKISPFNTPFIYVGLLNEKSINKLIKLLKKRVE
jgi:hypothetical protein